MIHEQIMALCRVECPLLTWSVNYQTIPDNTGTVYQEGGPPPDTYDFKWRYPEYMVYIRAKDWDLAATYVQKVMDRLNGLKNFYVTESGRMYYVQSLFALGEVIRIGVDSTDNMEYSINLQATIREEK